MNLQDARCNNKDKERDSLKSTIIKTDVWPISKDKLIRKHFKTFSTFTNEISFDNLNEVKAIPLQAWTGPEGSRRFRLPDFKTIGT